MKEGHPNRRSSAFRHDHPPPPFPLLHPLSQRLLFLQARSVSPGATIPTTRMGSRSNAPPMELLLLCWLQSFAQTLLNLRMPGSYHRRLTTIVLEAIMPPETLLLPTLQMQRPRVFPRLRNPPQIS